TGLTNVRNGTGAASNRLEEIQFSKRDSHGHSTARIRKPIPIPQRQVPAAARPLESRTPFPAVPGPRLATANRPRRRDATPRGRLRRRVASGRDRGGGEGA